MTQSIAVVGSACRFPGSASSPSRLWDLLKAPRDVSREFTSERLHFGNFYSQDGDRPGRTNVQNRSYLLQEDCRLFDASFFRINNKEAHSMDPQQRILLETVFEALETAGKPLHTIEGSNTSVYVGVMTSDYTDIQMRDPDSFPTYTATGTARSILANRISYFFDLKGPSMSLDTACSSSLVALHNAVQGLRNGEATQAIVAGSALLLDPSMYIAESKLRMLSPDSRSRMWDKDANGYARGEGAAAILLKPLANAIEDNDDIECIIRETAVNTDGRTPGITMPNSSAQRDLIRQTYERAGLDPIADRCQYFECHGTGTLAGDLVEARAIQEAFFPGDYDQNYNGDPLFCGSIKTVIGHLEGCAGLAGVLKTSLAIQNGKIPPNMHFSQLNSAVEPFCTNIRVPTALMDWPTQSCKLRRASVNSFGFGGTNAHVIIESYQPAAEDAAKDFDIINVDSSVRLVRPFVFSAKSRSSLVRYLQQMADYIQMNPSLDLDRLSWVLHSRRSVFNTKTAITASEGKDLLDLLKTRIQAGFNGDLVDTKFDVSAPASHLDRHSRILAVFTGQGAQWARMGLELMNQCPMFRESLEKCDRALRTLPDGPRWSILQELAVGKSKSRIYESELSQTLCAAVQVALVDLLRAVGVHPDVVVGHSSGEIGAAYAVGILGAREAMGIAYYRGSVVKLACGDAGQEGAMAAVGIPFQDAVTFCSQPTFCGRITVAASNTPSNVTISGDSDAVHEASKIFDQRNVFFRLLRVERAYHSHHMLRCAEAYSMRLKQLRINLQSARKDCVWVSTVHGREISCEESLEKLKGPYWVDNLLNPVRFSQTLESVLMEHPSFATVLEVGPHPAMKGPVKEIFELFTDSSPRYLGCLQRQRSDIESLSTALCELWCHLGPSAVSLASWHTAFPCSSRHRMLKGLPGYSWDHDQVFWHEGRLSREYRLGAQRPHALLGRLQQDCIYDMTWRNVFRLKDIPWVKGHVFQGQSIFPGAGYISMAIEAAVALVRPRPLKMIEIYDMDIVKALVISEDCGLTETLFTIKGGQDHSDLADHLTLKTQFTCYSSCEGQALEKTCDGRLIIHFSLPPAEHNPFPLSPPCEDELPPLDVDRFFTSVSTLGIDYYGAFRALRSINRIWGTCRASASWAEGDLEENYTLHPAVLDAGFQAGFATFSSLAENALRCTYLPAKIKHVFVDLAQGDHSPSQASRVTIEASLTHWAPSVAEVDINLHTHSNNIPNVRIDGLVLRAVGEAQPSNDRLLFAKTIWDMDIANDLSFESSATMTEEELEYIDAIERTTLFYLQDLYRRTHPEEIAAFKQHHQLLILGIEALLDPIRKGEHAVLKEMWLHDSRQTIDAFLKRYPDSVDLRLLTAVGENLLTVVRGESEMLEHMLKDDLLDRLYVEGRGFAVCNSNIAALMRKISHKYPRTRILEIGAGTGGTTRSVFNELGDAFASYVYTDVSAGFFERATEKFAKQLHKMRFMTFNVEQNPLEQDFIESSFDVVIAANVLHATRSLSDTVKHVRTLLRPGGYLIAAEVTGTMLRETGLMGGLEGWWLGAEDGRFPSPGVSAEKWDDLLRNHGFSGIDKMTYDCSDASRHNCSVFVTRAVDHHIKLLHDPLSCPAPISECPILIIGGQTVDVSRAILRVEKSLKRFTPDILSCPSIDALDSCDVGPKTTVLCLAELDQAIFSQRINTKSLKSLQKLLWNSTRVLWVTKGRLSDDPYSNMMVGIGRSLAAELPKLQMQFLDFDQELSLDTDIVVQYLLRMILLSSPQYHELDMLWVQEPEIAVKGRTAFIPRLVPDQDSNEALNANFRRITRLVGPSAKIEISSTTSTPSLLTSQHHPLPRTGVEINVDLSVALHIGNQACRFLCFGYLRGSNKPAFAVTESNSSVASVREEGYFEPSPPYRCDAEVLLRVGSFLVASHVLSNSPLQGAILVHGPPTAVAEAILKLAELMGKKVVIIQSASNAAPPDHVFVHPLAKCKTVALSIPSDATVLWRFSTIQVGNILPCLPKNCAVEDIYSSFPIIPYNGAVIAAAYKTATSADIEVTSRLVRTRNLGDFLQDRDQEPLSVVLNWQRTTTVEAVLSPTWFGDIFAADKTYLLVGMTGELGQSLCRFMVRCGARHIALGSRNAVVDAEWLRSVDLAGAKIRVLRMNVADRASVQETVLNIESTMPTIAGVANAALTLEDSLFVNTKVSAIEKQLNPKVDGTVFLDEVLAHKELDFFVLFSSLGSQYGNPGQSIYHAANMFMTSFAEKRRRTGRHASVINIGMILDLGYVAKSQRAGSGIEQHLRSQFYTPLAEVEFHHLFGQAVIFGHPQSPNADLTMGMQPFVDVPNASGRPPWYKNPRFSHMIISGISEERSAYDKATPQQHHDRLKEAKSADEAMTIFEEIFCQKIESMMKIPAISISVDAPLSDFGLDSLLAVEIRMWISKCMGVHIPLLAILGHESISSISSQAVHALLGALGGADGQTELENSPEAAQTSPGSLTSEMKDDYAAEYLGPPDSPTTSSHNTSPSSLPSTLGTTALSEYDCSVVTKFSRTESMSFPQADLHFLQSLLNDGTAFNVTAQYEVKGQLNAESFKWALEKTLSRHAAFQTHFFPDPSSAQVLQGIMATTDFQERFTHTYANSREDVQHSFRTLAEHKWDLASGKTFRAILLTHAAESHTILFGCHHIIMDGMSWDIFLRDLDRAYRMGSTPGSPLLYVDIVRQQFEAIESGALEKSISYWLRHLDPPLPVLPLLPFAQKNSRRPQLTWDNHTMSRYLDLKAIHRIKTVSRTCRTTQMQFYLAGMQTLFVQYLGVDEICVGVADAGRGMSEAISEIIGHFTNLLPMRFRMNKERSFAKLLQDTSVTVLNGLNHANVPLGLILERQGTERSSTHTPLFQVAFNYRPKDLLHRRLGNISMDLAQYRDAKTPYDLTFSITETTQGPHLIELSSNATLYSEIASRAILETFIDLLRVVSANASQKLKDYKLCDNVKAGRALGLGRGARILQTWPSTLTERLREVCASSANEVAVKDAQSSATYSQLISKSESIAAALTELNIRCGDRIAVLSEPCIDTIAAMLGILHIGAVYVPLDVSLPTSRHQSIIKACRPNMVLYSNATSELVAKCGMKDFPPATNISELPTSGYRSPVIASNGEQDAFLLFTSGSTGTPKGINLTQSGIMNYAAAKHAMLDLRQITVLQQSSLGFDMSIAQAFNAFVNAGTLVIAPKQCRGDPAQIARLMLDESIDFTIATPSEYLMLNTFAADTLAQCNSWRNACSGGEVVTERLIAAFQRLELPNLTLTDCYGPTEASCAVTLRKVPVQASHNITNAPCPVGKPIMNTSIYIIDDNSNVVPIGFSGEICIGGACVAKGYIDAKLGERKFVSNPFATPEDLAQGWNCMYKTGDKGYVGEDGSLMLLGRIDGDSLVKLRGLRIELSEVENAILEAAHGSFLNVVATIRGQSDFLVGHVILKPGKDLQQAELDRIRIDLPLPGYMIPTMLIPIDKLPMTPNGKVDRAAVAELPLPQRTPNHYNQGSLTVVESELRYLWREILGEASGTANIDADTDFFAVGGNSLLLVVLQSALKEKMGARIALHELYYASTLRAMATATSNERSQLVTETIDWATETAIPEHVAKAHGSKPSSPAPCLNQRQVILTGANGFLGSQILEALVRCPNVARVHCIGIPSASQDKVITNPKVAVYTGSLSSPTFGLSKSQITKLQSKVDQIIHAGSQGHCLNNYNSLRDANYLSTTHLAALALPRRVPLHYISSPRVILQSGACTAPPVSMAAHPPPTDGSQGFTASKWASECFLEKVALQLDLPVVIHRPCAVVGAEAPHDDALSAVIRYSILSRTVPAVPNAEGFFDFRDVAEVAGLITQGPVVDGKVVFRHYSSGVKVKFGELAGRIEDLHGGRFERVSLEKWCRKAVELGIEDLIVRYLEANVAGAGRLTFPYLGE